jgi:CrcB protein
VSALLVGIGGAVGSVLRFWITGLTQGAAAGTTLGVFPVGTLVVNVAGCLLIGALAQLWELRSSFSAETRALLMTGFLGGFTTFSAFANETVAAWRAGAAAIAALNVVLSVAACVAGVVAGRAAMTALVK